MSRLGLTFLFSCFVGKLPTVMPRPENACSCQLYSTKQALYSAGWDSYDLPGYWFADYRLTKMLIKFQFHSSLVVGPGNQLHSRDRVHPPVVSHCDQAKE